MNYCRRYGRKVSLPHCLACGECRPPGERVDGRMCEKECVMYVDLNIHQRINAKSWVRELYQPEWVLMKDVTSDYLTEMVMNNIDQPCDRESKLYRKNWRINRRRYATNKIQSKGIKRAAMGVRRPAARRH